MKKISFIHAHLCDFHQGQQKIPNKNINSPCENSWVFSKFLSIVVTLRRQAGERIERTNGRWGQRGIHCDNLNSCLRKGICSRGLEITLLSRRFHFFIFKLKFSISESLFQLKFCAKQLDRLSKKAEKEQRANEKKVIFCEREKDW